MALLLSQIARLASRTLLLNEHAGLPILFDVILHALIVSCVLVLLKVLLLAENLVCQSDFLSGLRSVGDLLWLELFVSFKEQSLIHVYLYISLAIAQAVPFII